MSLGFFRKIFPASVLSAVVLTGCAAPPTKPVPQTFSGLTKFYGASIHDIVYDPEYYGNNPLAYDISPALSFAMAVYAKSNNVQVVHGADGGGAIDPLALGAMSATPGSSAFGALALLDAVGSISVPQSPQYTVSPDTFSKLPFLSFYKIIPVQVAKTRSVADYFGDLKLALGLEVAAHNGALKSDDSLAFDGSFLWPTLHDTSVHKGYAGVAGVDDFNCYPNIDISWSAPQACFGADMGNSEVQLGAITLPQHGKTAVPGAGVVVYVNTGRPVSNGFMTPSTLSQMLSKAPLPEGWYAVYNTEVNGQVEIAVLYNGETTYFPLKK